MLASLQRRVGITTPLPGLAKLSRTTAATATVTVLSTDKNASVIAASVDAPTAGKHSENQLGPFEFAIPKSLALPAMLVILSALEAVY